MSEMVLPSHEALLRLCAAAAPNPWYPKGYVQSSGVSRESIDSPLNDLRLAGLITLTDWIKETGQGYVLTDLGEQALRNPAYLAQIRDGMQPPPARIATHEAKSEDGSPTRFERGEEARSALYDPQAPRVMPVLLLVNLIAFGFSLYAAIRANVPIGTFISEGNAAVLHEVGALSALDLVHQEWWRLLTSTFLHFGLLHLLANTYSLWALGQYESLWSPPRFLVIYLTSAFGGSCAAMIWDPGDPSVRIVVAGASGAIWGLMTSLLAWFLINRSHVESERLTERMPNFVVLIVLNVGISFMPGISASAHFGGGLIGFIVGSLLHVQRYASGPRRTGATVLIALLPFICFTILAEVMLKDPRWQRIERREKDRAERDALVRFIKDVVPTIDAAEIAVESVRDDAPELLNKTPDKRGAEAVANLRKNLKDALVAIKKATDQIGDKPIDDEKRKQARAAALDYLAAAKGLIEQMDAMLADNAVWNRQSGEANGAVAGKLAAWHAARDALR